MTMHFNRLSLKAQHQVQWFRSEHCTAHDRQITPFSDRLLYRHSHRAGRQLSRGRPGPAGGALVRRRRRCTGRRPLLLTASGCQTVSFCLCNSKAPLQVRYLRWVHERWVLSCFVAVLKSPSFTVWRQN